MQRPFLGPPRTSVIRRSSHEMSFSLRQSYAIHFRPRFGSTFFRGVIRMRIVRLPSLFTSLCLLCLSLSTRAPGIASIGPLRPLLPPTPRRNNLSTITSDSRRLPAEDNESPTVQWIGLCVRTRMLKEDKSEQATWRWSPVAAAPRIFCHSLTAEGVSPRIPRGAPDAGISHSRPRAIAAKTKCGCSAAAGGPKRQKKLHRSSC